MLEEDAPVSPLSFPFALGDVVSLHGRGRYKIVGFDDERLTAKIQTLDGYGWREEVYRWRLILIRKAKK